MNKKEIAEIRRHIRRERSNITALYGCFVNQNKEVISEFRQSIATMPEFESDKFFSLLKKNLNGNPGKNLIDIEFTTEQAVDSPEHNLLMKLRDSECKDDEARAEFFQKIIDATEMETGYLILLGYDTYDVPFNKSEDLTAEMDSTETYRFLLSCVCPVKLSKAVLEYKTAEKEFHDSGIANQLAEPVIGFLFPAFDERSTNIYNALLYTKDSGNNQEDFVKAIFNTTPTMAADQQKETFKRLLERTLENECSLDVIQAIYNELDQKLQIDKEAKKKEISMFEKEEIQNVLYDAGVTEEKIKNFEIQYDEIFGEKTKIPVQNVMESKKFEIQIPNVSIRMVPEKSDLIETRIIDGVKYIMICADNEDIQFNGISITIDE